MIKKKIIGLLLFGLTFFSGSFTIFAFQNDITVLVRIEGHNKTLAEGYVNAYTAIEAVQKLAGNVGIPIEFTYNGGWKGVNAIDGYENGFLGGNDQWLWFLRRGEYIYIESDLLDKILARGDELVLYYGDLAKTDILSKLVHEEAFNGVIFEIDVENMGWTEKNGSWVLDDRAKPLENIKIHIQLPNTYSKILRTDKEGKAAAALNQLGVYRYYAELYEENSIPRIVKTCDQFFFYGAENLDKITRGEAAAFIVNNYNVPSGSENKDFSDLTKDHKHYSQIQSAIANGILNGYGDGTVRPDDDITLLQLGIMLYKVLPDDLLASKLLVRHGGIPEWAYEEMHSLIEMGAFIDVELEWDGPVSTDAVIQIYKNTSDHKQKVG